MDENDKNSMKIVAIGDGEVGKTCLLFSYAKKEFPANYCVTVFESYAVNVNVDDVPYIVTVFDTAGQEDYSKLRYFCYPKTDLFLLCFSVINPCSFDNVINKWLPDIEDYFRRRKCEIPKILLVGTKIDLREDFRIVENLVKNLQKPIKFEEGKKLANQCGLAKYVECSALTQAGVKHVFDEAITSILDSRRCSKQTETRKPLCTYCVLF